MLPTASALKRFDYSHFHSLAIDTHFQLHTGNNANNREEPLPVKTMADSLLTSRPAGDDDVNSVDILTPPMSECGQKEERETGSPSKEEKVSADSKATTDKAETPAEVKDEAKAEDKKEDDAKKEEVKKDDDAKKEEVKKDEDKKEDEKKEDDTKKDDTTKADEKKDDAKSEEKKDGDDKKDGEEKKEEEKKEPILVGMTAESKNLYAKYDSEQNRTWSEEAPKDVEEAAENEETQKYAVIVRKKKPKEADSTKPLIIDSIVVQSPHLKKIISEVLEDYPGVTTNVSRLTFAEPFECFVHRWDKFVAAKDDPELDPAAKTHLELLLDILKQDLGELIQLREDYLKNKVVSFEHAWSIFIPGCTVFGLKNKKPVAVQFKKGYYAKTDHGNIYALDCKMIDWDGVRMGWVNVQHQIHEYLGTKPFTELPCYPLQYHSNPEATTKKLLERGKQFEDLAGFHYKAYNGTAMWHPDPRKTRMETVASRIVIDGVNWEKSNPEHTVWLTELHEETSDEDDANKNAPDNLWDKLMAMHDRNHADTEGTMDNFDAKEKVERTKLTDEQLILTCPLVRGYALKNKRWMEFFIDEITEVEFNDKAFDSLVLPTDQKELILAFAQSQVKYKDGFDDLISGKGKGIIMLLSGGPGIGKTLTAESVAEEMKVPLFVMSAGDLGLDAYEVESNLTRILEMVGNWNAVLLLDECDIFLEARDVHEMQRNRIVSIFLRTLEYYEGILFLTTNRASNIDPAFQSRIHVSLEYPNLDAQARMSVWKTFLARTISLDKSTVGDSAHDITDAELNRLSRLDLNGRQIKNVLKKANLLACHRGQRLKYAHLEQVLKVESQFGGNDVSGLYS